MCRLTWTTRQSFAETCKHIPIHCHRNCSAYNDGKRTVRWQWRFFCLQEYKKPEKTFVPILKICQVVKLSSFTFTCRWRKDGYVRIQQRLVARQISRKLDSVSSSEDGSIRAEGESFVKSFAIVICKRVSLVHDQNCNANTLHNKNQTNQQRAQSKN